jgi:hypothetical protein
LYGEIRWAIRWRDGDFDGELNIDRLSASLGFFFSACLPHLNYRGGLVSGRLLRWWASYLDRLECQLGFSSLPPLKTIPPPHRTPNLPPNSVCLHLNKKRGLAAIGGRLGGRLGGGTLN